MINLAPAARRAFPPLDKATVKAVACKLPAKKGKPLSVYHNCYTALYSVAVLWGTGHNVLVKVGGDGTEYHAVEVVSLF